MKEVVGSAALSPASVVDRPAIITSFVYPPIPLRQFDWCAYRDGTEENGHYGYGTTEQAAIADLLELEDGQ